MAAVLPDLPTRTTQRRHFSVPVRVELAETDLDTHDRTFGRLESKIDKLNARAVGLLISSTTATILFAVDIMRHF